MALFVDEGSVSQKTHDMGVFAFNCIINAKKHEMQFAIPRITLN